MNYICPVMSGQNFCLDNCLNNDSVLGSFLFSLSDIVWLWPCKAAQGECKVVLVAEPAIAEQQDAVEISTAVEL